MLRLAAQSWVDGFPNSRFFRYAIVPLVVSLRGKSDDAKVTRFTSLILFFTGLLKPDSQNVRAPPLDEKRRFWTRDKSISIDHFVPWQYLSHDELWNLSPTTKNINSMKGNQLPNLYEDFERLAELQHKALMMCNDYEIVRHKFKICLDYHVNSTEIRNSLYQPDIDLPSYRERLYNVIQPVYDSAKMGGFTEWIK